MSKFAIGVVVKDRWQLTKQLFESIYLSDQNLKSYDLFIIDNGSNEENRECLKDWINSENLNVKMAIFLPEVSIGRAWNLFLELSCEYEYRIKMDNDLILAYTPVAVQKAETKRNNKPYQMTTEFGTNPGSIPIASVVKGATRVRSQKPIKTSRFLDMMSDFIIDKNLGACALCPIKPETILHPKILEVVQNYSWRKAPFLIGACMMISKKCFKRVGYFDEILPCFIDREYSQRCMAHGYNLGYLTDYWVYHAGHDQPTLNGLKTEENKILANKWALNLELKRGYLNTKWSGINDKLKKIKKTNKPTIVHLTS